MGDDIAGMIPSLVSLGVVSKVAENVLGKPAKKKKKHKRKRR